MAKIKHIAIRTPNPEKTATFYKYEIKYRGPDNQVIDITASGWIGT